LSPSYGSYLLPLRQLSLRRAVDPFFEPPALGSVPSVAFRPPWARSPWVPVLFAPPALRFRRPSDKVALIALFPRAGLHGSYRDLLAGHRLSPCGSGPTFTNPSPLGDHSTRIHSLLLWTLAASISSSCLTWARPHAADAVERALSFPSRGFRFLSLPLALTEVSLRFPLFPLLPQVR